MQVEEAEEKLREAQNQLALYKKRTEKVRFWTFKLSEILITMTWHHNCEEDQT
jgi:hypothetical protein